MKLVTPLLLIILAIAAFVFMYSSPSITPEMVEPSASPVVEAPERFENVEGETVCLPHRDTSGPVTLECAIGLQVGSDYYSIDTNLLASLEAGELVRDTGNKVRVSGIYTPVEELSSDHWQKYAILGILSVTTVEEL